TDRPKDAYGVRAILPRPEGRGLPRTGSIGRAFLRLARQLGQGKMAGEGAAPPRLADDVQASAMAQQHMLDDGQPQAGAAGVRGAAGVDPVEALGETRDMPGLDARAGVTHRQVRALVVAPPADVHLATVGGVLDRV